jgi:hypothetical protein
MKSSKLGKNKSEVEINLRNVLEMSPSGRRADQAALNTLEVYYNQDSAGIFSKEFNRKFS